MNINIWDNEILVNVLEEGGVVVMPTDTIYGIVGRALNKGTVERIYGIKRRTPEKPCIILISDVEELKKFSISLSPEQEKVLEKYWPGPVSIIFDRDDNKFEYLHRGTKTLAFRLPGDINLQNLLKKVGPLIAPSANTEGAPPAEDVSQAKEYFGLPAQAGDLVDPVRSRGSLRALATSNGVDLYVDGGKIKGKLSKLIQLHKDGSVDILRN